MVKPTFPQELLRKAIHIVAGLVIYFFARETHPSYSKHEIALVMFGFFIILLIFDFCRGYISFKIPFQSIWMRTKEHNKFLEATWFLLGAAVSLFLFDFDIALVSILMLSFGDSLAALAAILIPSPTIFGRSITHIISGLLINGAIGTIFITPIIGILMAITATIVDFWTRPDNLTIPFGSGLIGQLVRMILK